jgi:nucleotide-binding universal stress UspA family protein
MDQGDDFHVHVLYVQAPTIDDDVYLQPLLDEGERIVRVASRYLEARSIGHTTRVAIGYPSDTIVLGAKAERCTDIVMGVRTAIARFFSGSVSRRVVSEAGTPVTLVNATGEAIVRRPGVRRPALAAPG